MNQSYEARDIKFSGKKIYFLMQKKIVISKQHLHLSDSIISMFIIGPLIGSYWRGTWILMDTYSDFFPYFPSYLITSLVLIGLYLMRENGINFFKFINKFGQIAFYIQRMLRIMYTSFFALISVMNWRAAFGIYDTYFNVIFNDIGIVLYSENVRYILIIGGISFTALILLKCMRNLIYLPYTIVMDDEKTTYNFPTRFRINVSN